MVTDLRRAVRRLAGPFERSPRTRSASGWPRSVTELLEEGQRLAVGEVGGRGVANWGARGSGRLV